MPIDQEASGVDLHLAARSGDIHVIRSLVQIANVDLDIRDILGDSALLKAARYGHTEVVRALLLEGANVNAQDINGWSALHICIANNREDVFFALFSSNQESSSVNIEAVTSGGDTPLHMAAHHGRDWAIETLLLLGANLQATNDTKQRPFEVAKHESVLSMLQSSMTLGHGDTVLCTGANHEKCSSGSILNYDSDDVGIRMVGVGSAVQGQEIMFGLEQVGPSSSTETSTDQDTRQQKGILRRTPTFSSVVSTGSGWEENDSFEEGSSEGESSQDSMGENIEATTGYDKVI